MALIQVIPVHHSVHFATAIRFYIIIYQLVTYLKWRRGSPHYHSLDQPKEVQLHAHI